MNRRSDLYYLHHKTLSPSFQPQLLLDASNQMQLVSLVTPVTYPFRKILSTFRMQGTHCTCAGHGESSDQYRRGGCRHGGDILPGELGLVQVRRQLIILGILYYWSILLKRPGAKTTQERPKLDNQFQMAWGCWRGAEEMCHWGTELSTDGECLLGFQTDVLWQLLSRISEDMLWTPLARRRLVPCNPSWTRGH